MGSTSMSGGRGGGGGAWTSHQAHRSLSEAYLHLTNLSSEYHALRSFQIKVVFFSLDLTSSLEAKFGARSGQVHQIRGKTLEILLPQDAKVVKKSQFWGHI